MWPTSRYFRQSNHSSHVIPRDPAEVNTQPLPPRKNRHSAPPKVSVYLRQAVNDLELVRIIVCKLNTVPTESGSFTFTQPCVYCMVWILWNILTLSLIVVGHWNILLGTHEICTSLDLFSMHPLGALLTYLQVILWLPCLFGIWKHNSRISEIPVPPCCLWTLSNFSNDVNIFQVFANTVSFSFDDSFLSCTVHCYRDWT